MEQKLATAEGRKRYLRRQASVEPVFGIIKGVLGFRQFSLRGLQKVSLEWNLVCVAYNLKRLHKLFHLAKAKPSAPKNSLPAIEPGNAAPGSMFGTFVSGYFFNSSAKRNLRSLSRWPALFRLVVQTTLGSVSNPTGSWALMLSRFAANSDIWG